MNTIDSYTPDAIVIDAGLFPSNHRALQWIDRCDRIVCCDGAANAFIASGHIPWRIVGDCDSLDPEIMEKYSEIVRRIPEQESNDQTKSIRFLASEGYRKIMILGATGLREDHTIGNVSLLIEYLKKGIEARIYTDFGVFIPVHNHIRFSIPTGSQVSIFNFGATNLRAEGLRYPLRDFDSWWQGTLNETVAPDASISADGFFLVFLNY